MLPIAKIMLGKELPSQFFIGAASKICPKLGGGGLADMTFSGNQIWKKSFFFLVRKPQNRGSQEISQNVPHLEKVDPTFSRSPF